MLEIDIPTGFVVTNHTLKEYVKSGQTPNLRRAEFYYRKVVFYFDKVSKMLLNCMATPVWVFFPFFDKGEKLLRPYFLPWRMKPYKKGSILKGKNLLLGEQILLYKS